MPKELSLILPSVDLTVRLPLNFRSPRHGAGAVLPDVIDVGSYWGDISIGQRILFDDPLAVNVVPAVSDAVGGQ